MEHEFDRQIAVQRLGDGAGRRPVRRGPRRRLAGGRRRQRRLPAGRASATRCAPALPGKPDPIAVSAYYLSASVPGPATVSVDVRRDGGSRRHRRRRPAPGRRRRGSPRWRRTATSAGSATTSRTTAEEPDLPPPDGVRAEHRWRRRSCARIGAADGPLRHALPPRPRRLGGRASPAGTASSQAWFRLADGREPDPISLLLVVDALPPVTFDLGMPGWAPTLELTAHVRARPAPGWLKVARTRPATWPAGCSRRTARSGTPPAAWSPRAGSWRAAARLTAWPSGSRGRPVERRAPHREDPAPARVLGDRPEQVVEGQ